MPKLPVKPWWRADRNTWYTTYRGRQIPLAKGKTNRAEANRVFAKLIAGDKPRVAGDMTTLGQLCDMWVERSQKTDRPTTVKRNQWTANSLKSFVGCDIQARRVTENNVAEWINSKTWSRGTQVQMLAIARAIFNYGIRQRIVESNPCSGLSYGVAPARIHMMTHEQTETVLAYAKAHCSKQLHELMRIMHATGMRPSEAMRLETSWLSRDFSYATFPSHKTSRKTPRVRKVYFPDSIRDLVKELAKRNPTGCLLRNSYGRPFMPGTVNNSTRRMQRVLGMGKELCLESFRHQWITDALERGVPIATVAELCGNSVAVISRHYSKLASRTDHLSSAVDSVRPPHET